MSAKARFARSANLERDVSNAEPLDGYIVTARTADVADRLAAAALGKAGGAWSLTGPYGSGKSSLALLLAALFGPPGESHKAAFDLVDAASPATGESLRKARKKHGTDATGFHLGLATALREPLSQTVLRALREAVLRRYGRIPPARSFAASAALKGALADGASDDPRRTGPSPAALAEVARCLAEDAPLLLIIDEFGKNLEAIRDGGQADPYLLQQLAEAGQGSGLPIFILTLQHLSFEDYLAGADDAQRREWAKVQGRFEDVSFTESASQTRALMGTVFEVGDDRLRKRILQWAESGAKDMRNLGVPDLADPAMLAACYPLHPMAVMALPELCSRYGQHERTLFSFLAGAHPAAVPAFMSSTVLPESGRLPSLGLEWVYDFFAADGALLGASAGQSSRWTEIASRLRDAHGLTEPQSQMLKAVALLNLISTTGTIRASRRVLNLVSPRSDRILSELEQAGLVTFREFADEYRVWQGTDVDVRRLLEAARLRTQERPLADILSEVDEPRPAVAARHSAENDVLRVFARRYVDDLTEVEPPGPFSPFDGEALLVVGADGAPSGPSPSGTAAKPVAAAFPQDVADLEAAAREVAAVTSAFDDPAAQGDWVARRELGERLAGARNALEHALAAAFQPDACRWELLAGGDGPPAELPSGRGSAALSAAADIAYSNTPQVQNEMLNRVALTSQGAKARRMLLEAMIESGDQADLGFEGYGPEMAMYRAFLKRTGLHGFDERNGKMVFRKPTDESLQKAWKIMEEEFKRAKDRRVNLSDVFAALQSPPVGMKAGAVPVFAIAGLAAFREEVAIYEHGTFKPSLTPEVLERLVRNPRHFDIKHFANTTGARRQVIDHLAARLGVKPGFRKHRVTNVLSVMGHLVARVNRLENFTLRTGALSPSALKVREALVSAVEPDELLFDALPKAFGLRPIRANAKTCGYARAFAHQVGKALDELDSRFASLLDELFDLLLESCAEPSRLAISGQAASLQDKVLDPDVRAFILTLANDGAESDRDWLKAVATVVARKAPAEWADDDERRFRRDLPERVAAFHRLLALHAEHRAEGGGPFEPVRIAVTRPDGGEQVRLVSIDQEHLDVFNRELDAFVERLALEVTGSPNRARNALLALLGGRLFPAESSVEEKMSVPTTERRARVG